MTRVDFFKRAVDKPHMLTSGDIQALAVVAIEQAQIIAKLEKKVKDLEVKEKLCVAGICRNWSA